MYGVVNKNIRSVSTDSVHRYSNYLPTNIPAYDTIDEKRADVIELQKRVDVLEDILSDLKTDLYAKKYELQQTITCYYTDKEIDNAKREYLKKEVND